MGFSGMLVFIAWRLVSGLRLPALGEIEASMRPVADDRKQATSNQEPATRNQQTASPDRPEPRCQAIPITFSLSLRRALTGDRTAGT